MDIDSLYVGVPNENFTYAITSLSLTDRLPGVGCWIEIVVKPFIPYIERTYNLLWWFVYFAERVSSP